MPIKAMRDTSQLTFNMTVSKQIDIAESDLYADLFDYDPELVPRYCHKNGLLFTDDSLEWLKQVKDGSVDLVFADPPYNIKKADWDKFESQQQYIEWSMQWVQEVARVLKPSGSLYICGFSEILADLKHPSMRYFKGCKWLIWSYRNKANLEIGRASCRERV